MTKRLVVVAALMTLGSGAMAQDEGTSSGGGFFSGLSLNTNNKYQISLLLGNQAMFDQNLTYLTPKYSNNAADAIGLPGPKNSQSYSPLTYIRFNDLGSGDLVNMAGVQFTYFLTDAIDINASFGMDLRSTPKKDFIEGEQIKDMAVQGQKWIEGQFQNNWLLTLGGNYHFTVSNEKIDMYAGLQFGYQHGHINTYTPYTDADAAYLMFSALEEKANTLATAASACQTAMETAKSAWNSAQANQEAAKNAYDYAQEYYETAMQTTASRQTAVDKADEDFTKANTAWVLAGKPTEGQVYRDKEVAAIMQTYANDKYDDAVAAENQAKEVRDAAQTSWDDAQKAVTNTYNTYNTAKSKYTSAQSSADAAKKTAESAKANNEGTVLYTPRIGSGQIVCFTSSITAGVNYALSDGLFLGLEFSPYTFTYTSLSVCPKDNQVYKATAYANRFFANTLLKIGFRF